jgi:DNA-binding transcriptional LysR family regulator
LAVRRVLTAKRLTMQLKQANTLNFTRAGEKLHLSQSSVTEQLQSLESDLGTSLFDRSRRKLTLTPAGCRLLDRHHCT